MNTLSYRPILMAIPLLLILPLYSQEFSFTLRFEDAAGNKDSIVLGYDAGATDSVDPGFGEVDIRSQPWKPGLDVRISNHRLHARDSATMLPRFHLKRQIFGKHPFGPILALGKLEIRSRNWPITATWDSSLFGEIEREGSLISNYYGVDARPDNDYRAYMAETDEVTFLNHVVPLPDWFPPPPPGRMMYAWPAYVSESNDTIPLSIFIFANRGYTGAPAAISPQKHFLHGANDPFALHFRGRHLGGRTLSILGRSILEAEGYGIYISAPLVTKAVPLGQGRNSRDSIRALRHQ